MLPHQKQDYIKKTLHRLRMDLSDIDEEFIKDHDERDDERRRWYESEKLKLKGTRKRRHKRK